MSDLMQTIGILPILILIVAVFGFIAPNFFTESNPLNITRQASINIVLAAGMTFIILTGGTHLRGVDSRYYRRCGNGGVADPGIRRTFYSGGADARHVRWGCSTARWWPLPFTAAVYRHARYLYGASAARPTCWQTAPR